MTSRDLTPRDLTRRSFLAVAAAAVPALLTACSDDTPTAGGTPSPSPATLVPTPSCGSQGTEAQTEGPYFTPSSPEKSDLRADVSGGTPFVLTGTVLTTRCEPVGRALVDLWHADGSGRYDDSGYRLRGHVFTDSAGRFRFETVEAGLYPGRTRHLHVKVQAPNGPVLTTQLYWPGESGNAGDNIYSASLAMSITESGGTRTGTYDFVVES